MSEQTEKTLLLIRGSGGYSAFAEGMLQKAAEIAGFREIVSCKLTFTAEKPPAPSVIPYKKGLVGVITLEGASGPLDDEMCRQLALDLPGLAGCYRADCALPVAYEKNWEDGRETPGAGLLTLFRSRPDLSYAEFLDRWFNGHTPISLAIHPLWNYARNVVSESIVPGSEPHQGIVEEHFFRREDLVKPRFFFDGLFRMPGNMLRVLKDSRGFIDMKTIEPYFIREYWIKSPSPVREEIPVPMHQ